MKDLVRGLFRRTLERISIAEVLGRAVERSGTTLRIGEETLDLDTIGRRVVVAAGKSAAPMARALCGRLEPYAMVGFAVGPESVDPPAGPLAWITGGHPFPDEGSFRAGQRALDLLTDLGPNDVVFFLLSGGGSALLEWPIDPRVSERDCRELHRLLVTGEAGIVEVNALRKHLSAVKGGRLAQRAFPARQVTLYASDVPREHPDAVASGPSMPDASTLDDCRKILDRFRLRPRLPVSIRELWEENTIPETPKADDRAFRNSSWHRLIDNDDALQILFEEARAQGWWVEIDTSVDGKPVGPAAVHLVDRLQALRRRRPHDTVCLLSGGELISPVRGDGVGGRNQAFVLHGAAAIAGQEITLLSAGTDGVDGNSPAAGGVADGRTEARGIACGLSLDRALRNSDSHGYLDRLGDTIVTGPTGQNVRDLRIIVAPREPEC